VHVFGSGFDVGSRADWALHGVVSAKVATNSTRFVSSTELVANISIARDATLANYDVMVTTSSGKGGIGTECFVITSKTTDLGTLGGTQSGALGVNNFTQVVGWSFVPSGAEHAFIWTKAGGMRDLGTLGGASSRAYAINDNGQVVGSSATVAGEKHAFLWTAADGMRDLGTLGGIGSDARAISKNGAIVGASYLSGGGTSYAFYWSAGVMENLGVWGSIGLSVNNAMQVVGSTSLYNPGRGVLWTKSAGVWTSEILIGPNPQGSALAYGINEAGQVVGGFITTSGQRGTYMWTTAGGYTVLPLLPNGTGAWPYAINDAGRIGGFATNSSSAWHPTVWDSNGNGWTVTTFAGTSKADSWVAAINDNHQAVGSLTKSALKHAALWEVPAP
jgi:probable HAF family extracellular repeat protein